MAESMPYEKVGSPVIGQVYDVPIATSDMWLTRLNARKSITASLATHSSAAADMARIFVSMEFPYDRPIDLQARMGTPEPHRVMHAINEVMCFVAQTLSRQSSTSTIGE